MNLLIEKWDEIYNIFSKEAVLSGKFDNYANNTKGLKKGTSEVDKEFLKECVEKINIKSSPNKAIIAFLRDERFYSVLRNKKYRIYAVANYDLSSFRDGQ